MGGQVLNILRRNGFDGRVVPVNPHYAEIGGLPCFPTMAAAGEAVDLAIIVIPALAVLPALVDCATAGTRSAIVISSGFAEDESAPASLQADVAAAGATNGHADYRAERAGFPQRDRAGERNVQPCGRPQQRRFSGGAAGAGGDRGAERRNGVRLVQSRPSAGDAVQYGRLDRERGRPDGGRPPGASGDGPEHGRNLADAREHPRPGRVRGGGGRSAARWQIHRGDQDRAVDRGQAPRRRHTRRARPAGTRPTTRSSIGMGSWWRPIWRRRWCWRRRSRANPTAAGGRVGVVTISGGAGALAADLLDAAGLSLAVLSEATQATISGFIPSYGSARNPVDLTAGGAAGGGTLRTVGLMLDGPGGGYHCGIDHAGQPGAGVGGRPCPGGDAGGTAQAGAVL